MNKKDLVSAILSIEAIDTKANLMSKTNKELEQILQGLQETSEPQATTEVTPQPEVDMQAMLEKMMAEKLAELKEQARKEIQDEIKSAPEDVEVKPQSTPIKKKEIDRFEPIPVMNVCNGKLVYSSKKTGATWVWGEYGDVEYVEFQELLTMRSGQKRFLDDPFLLILDEDVVHYLGLNKMYDNLVDLDSLDNIFKMNNKDFQEVIEKSPKGIIHSIVTRAKQKVADGTLDSMWKVNYLNNKFNTDIGQRG
jgi:hypothetical protein